MLLGANVTTVASGVIGCEIKLFLFAQLSNTPAGESEFLIEIVANAESQQLCGTLKSAKAELANSMIAILEGALSSALE